MSLKLPKAHKLCSLTAIDALFAQSGRGALAFPVRMVWRTNPMRTHGAPVQFLISVPKKRLRHAVDRVTMRRRIREAYRLHRALLQPLFTAVDSGGERVDVAFIYVAPTLQPYHRVERAICKLLPQLLPSASSAHENTPLPADHHAE
jgi:ribonuclease P protein component